jgi:hypothetical protein
MLLVVLEILTVSKVEANSEEILKILVFVQKSEYYSMGVSTVRLVNIWQILVLISSRGWFYKSS